MFRSPVVADPPSHHVVPSEQLVPLVELELSLDAPSAVGYVYLAGHGVAVMADDSAGRRLLVPLRGCSSLSGVSVRLVRVSMRPLWSGSRLRLTSGSVHRWVLACRRRRFLTA